MGWDSRQQSLALLLAGLATILLMPPSPTRPSVDGRSHPRDGERYLLLTSTSEGISGWSHTLLEALHLAKALDLVFVEPCVRGGRLVPCNPGRVTAGLPEAWAEGMDAAHDPLRVPAFAEDCTPTELSSNAAPPSNGWAHPLRLYLSLPSLRSIYPNIISFDDWAHAQLPADAPGATRAGTDIIGLGGGRYQTAAALCGSGTPTNDSCTAYAAQDGLRHAAFAPMPVVKDGTLFRSVKRPGPLEPRLLAFYKHVIASAPAHSRSLFIAGAWRGFAFPFGSFGPPDFNDIHLHAVAAWLGGGARPMLPLPRFTALQWRSETVPGGRIPDCAAQIERGMRKRWRSPDTPTLRVLLADIPAPNSPCAMWSVYRVANNSSSDPRKAAVSRLMAGVGGVPLRKYDAEVTRVDAGVLSVRDVLLAVEAESLLGCARGGGGCERCYRATSGFARWIRAMRKRRGKRSVNVF